MAIKICPRCGKNKYDFDIAGLYPALSRRDNKTYICSQCGEIEGLIDAGLLSADKVERAFVSKIKEEN